MRLRFAFRLEAAPATGLGHLMRSIALAEAFRAEGHECVFYLSQVDPGIVSILDVRGFAAESLNLAAAQTGHDEDLMRFAGRARGGVAVVDSYDIPDAYVNALVQQGIETVCFDDHAERRLPHTLLLNGHPGTERLYVAGQHGRVLAGAAYALIRSEFVRHRDRNGLAPFAPRVETVLVTLGGTDPAGNTLRVVEALNAVPHPFAIHIIVTSYFRHFDGLHQIAEGAERRIRIARDPSDLPAEMSAADIAVAPASVTAYELACLGVPVVAMRLYENQRFVHAGLIEGGLAADGGEDAAAAVRALLPLLASAEKRLALRSAAARVFDGAGARRTAAAILSALAPHKEVTA